MRIDRRSSGLKGFLALCVLTVAASVGAFDQAAGQRDGTATFELAALPLPATVRTAVERPVAAAAEERPKAAEPFWWWARRDDKRIKLQGFAPSEEDRKTVHGMIKANMPDLEIDDRTKVADGAPPQQIWLGAVSFTLLQLAQLKFGVAQCTGTDLHFEGEARSAAAYTAVKNALTSQLPTGLAVRRFSLTPPLAKPFAWSAQYEDGALTLIGSIPNSEFRERLLLQATRLFEGKTIVDRMELAGGAPEYWESVVSSALRQLGRLEAGRVGLSDTALTIEGVASNKSTATEVVAAIKESLPKSYESRESIRYRMQSGPVAPPASSRGEPERRSADPAVAPERPSRRLWTALIR